MCLVPWQTVCNKLLHLAHDDIGACDENPYAFAKPLHSAPDEYVVVAWYGLLLSIAVEGRLALSPLTTHLTLQ